MKKSALDTLPNYVHGQRTMFYAGVGSRETPPEIRHMMSKVAKELEDLGYILRTGGAEGADVAFERGLTDVNNKEVYLSCTDYVDKSTGNYRNQPTRAVLGLRNERTDIIMVDKYPNHTRRYVNNEAVERARTIAKEVHANPNALSPFALDLTARNVFQIFGKELDIPVDFVLAWTPLNKNGDPVVSHEQKSYDKLKKVKLSKGEVTYDTGGTGMAISYASLKGIPVINMVDPKWREQLEQVLKTSADGRKNTQPTTSCISTISLSTTSEVAIDSNQTELKYELTNPSHTPPRGFLWEKGNAPIRRYLSTGIDYAGRHYLGIDEAYQANSSKTLRKSQDDDYDYALMVDLLEIKLNTFQLLVAFINKRGGLDYINKLTEEGMFKKALIEVFRRYVTRDEKIIDVGDDKRIKVLFDVYNDRCLKSLKNRVNTIFKIYTPSKWHPKEQKSISGKKEYVCWKHGGHKSVTFTETAVRDNAPYIYFGASQSSENRYDRYWTKLARDVEKKTKKPKGYYNHILINKFDVSVGIGVNKKEHQDNEPFYRDSDGNVGSVAILSIGHTNDVHTFENNTKSLKVNDNTITEMSTGAIRHYVPGAAEGGRISITFRHIPDCRLSKATDITV